MKKLISILTAMLLICITSINAQDIHRVEEIEIVNSHADNVTIQIKTAELGQTVLNKVNQTNVNTKAGFNAQFNADNTMLTLNFTQQFNENELNVLFKYAGIQLNTEDFIQLYNLVNQ